MKVVLIGGGTGGHLFPALAVAQELEMKDCLPYVITDFRCKPYLSDKYTFNIKIFDISKPRPGIVSIPLFLLQNIKFAINLIRMYRNIKPDLIIGFGSYVSFIPLLIGVLFRIPIMIHEQNSYLGKVNKFFSYFAEKIMLSFKNTTNLPKNLSKILVTGNPIRKTFANLPLESKNYDGDEFTILIVGGSQGAKFFADIMPEVIREIVQNITPNIKIKVFHQASKEYHAKLTKEYSIGDRVKSEVAEFFTDVDHKYLQSHLVIGRSGASTVSELIELKQPSILIPLPSAADDHQFYNAQAITEVNGGICIRQKNANPKLLAEHILARINDRSLLKTESDNLKQLQCNAIVNITNTILKFAQKNHSHH